MRAVVRLCPHHTYPNINNSMKGRESAEIPSPNYYYEATDLEHFTVYENNVRENGKTFECKHIYDGSATQFDIFANEVVPLIEKCFQGQDCAVLYFGSDFAGKRFSLEGLPEYPGFFYRTIELLFDTIAGEDPTNKCRLFYSSFTIERETIFDNLPSDSSSQIKLRDDKKKGIIAEGGTLIELYDIQQALQVYYESTSKFYKSLSAGQNKHLVINIRIDISNACKSNFTKGEYGILSMVSVGTPTIKPQSSLEKNQELEVANFWVNHLGSCMNSLHNSVNPSIPFHKSKFTLLLRDFLLGNKDNTSLFNLSPLHESYKFVVQTLTICNRLSKTTPLTTETKKSISKPSSKSTSTSEKKTSSSDLEKKTQEVDALTRENRELSEKMKSIEDQLRKIQEKQEKQTMQINALSPTKPKDDDGFRTSKKMPIKPSSKSVLNTSTTSEIDRYRDVMEGTITKLKQQIKSLEMENSEVKKEMTKREGAYKKKISELVSDVKRDAYQKQVQELQTRVESLTKTVHELKSQKKNLTENEKTYRAQLEKMHKENQDLKQKLGIVSHSIPSSVVGDNSSSKSVTSEENIETDNEAYTVNEEEYDVHSLEDDSEYMNEPSELPAEKSDSERKLEREVMLLKEALAVALSQKTYPASNTPQSSNPFRISNQHRRTQSEFIQTSQLSPPVTTLSPLSTPTHSSSNNDNFVTPTLVNNNNQESNQKSTVSTHHHERKFKSKHFSLFELNGKEENGHIYTPSSLIFYTPSSRKKSLLVSNNDNDNNLLLTPRATANSEMSVSPTPKMRTSSLFVKSPNTKEKSPHQQTLSLEEFPLPDFSSLRKFNHITFDQFEINQSNSKPIENNDTNTVEIEESEILSEEGKLTRNEFFQSPLPSINELLSQNVEKKENTVNIGPYSIFIDTEYPLKSNSKTAEMVFGDINNSLPENEHGMTDKYFYDGINTITKEKVNVISQLVRAEFVETYRERSKKLLLVDNNVTGIIRFLDVAEIQLNKNNIESIDFNTGNISTAGSIFYIFVEPCLLMYKIIQKTKIEEKKFSYPILLEWLSQLSDGLANIHEQLETVHGNIDVNSIFFSKIEESMKIGNMLLITPQITVSADPMKSPSIDKPNERMFEVHNTNKPIYHSFTPLDLGGDRYGGICKYDFKTEVWLFGILMITIITMKNMNVITHCFLDNDQSFVSSIFQLICKQYNDRFSALIWRCCHFDPSYRPNMRELCQQLGLLKKYRSISGSTTTSSTFNNSFYENDVNQYQKRLDDIRVNMELGSILSDLYECEDGMSEKQSGNKLPTRNSNSYDILPLSSMDGPAVLPSLISVGRTIMRYVNKHYKIKDKKKKKLKLASMKTKLKKIAHIQETEIDNRRSSKKTLEEELKLRNHTRVFEHQEEVDLKILQAKIANQYSIIAVIGSGSQGTVTKAYDSLNNRYVAIKRIRMKDNNDTLLASKEISAMFSLNDNDNICKIYNWFIYCENREDKKTIAENLSDSEDELDFDEDDDEEDEYDFKDYANETWYIGIVMEYCSEGDLRKALRYCRESNTYFKNSTVKKWLNELVSAIDNIHRRNLMHRDISTKNIFLHSHSELHPANTLIGIPPSYFDCCHVKIGDMGLSIKLEELNRTNSAWGTRRWMAPEQRLGKRYDSTVDIWSLGCIALEMVLQYSYATNGKSNNSMDNMDHDMRHVDYYQEIKNNPNFLNDILRPLESYYDDNILEFIKKCLVIEPWKRAKAQQLYGLLNQDIRSVESAEVHYDQSLEEFHPSPFSMEKKGGEQDHAPTPTPTNVPSNKLIENASLSNLALLQNERDQMNALIEKVEESQHIRKLSNPVFIELGNDNKKYTKPEPKSTHKLTSTMTLESTNVLTSHGLSTFFKEIEVEENHEKESQTMKEHNNESSNEMLPEEFSTQVKRGHEKSLHKLLQKSISDWTTNDVGIWLISIDFSKFVENFQSQNITGRALLLIREEDMKDVGVLKLGDKLLLWNMIQNLRQVHDRKQKK